MFVAPIQMLVVRSCWRPAFTEKSADRITLAHGPGQPAGGVNENGLGLPFSGPTLEKSCTTHGVVLGRVSGGSAVAVFAEPICSGLCAIALVTINKIAAMIRTAILK
jgi:hypothetical protein